MTRQKIHLRLDQDLVQWLDHYAEKRRWTRTQVLQEALLHFKSREESLQPEGSGGGRQSAAE